MRFHLAVLAVGASWLSASGCRPVDACAEPGTACGGDPVARWIELDTCLDPALFNMATAKRTYRGQPVLTAGQAPPEPTSTDWCADLDYGPSGIGFLNLPRDPSQVLGAYLSMQGDDSSSMSGSYGALVTRRDTTSIEFSKTCLTRFGYASTDCSVFAEAFAAFGTGLGGVKQTSCRSAPAGGCICAYTVDSDAAGSNLSGRWRRNGTVLTFYPSSMVLPTQADYCVEGDRLTLWGHERTSIFDIAGLRTLTFDRIVCGNMKVERGEGCDPPNQTTCSATCQTIAAP